jgi:starvation-inducible outer membrane lipoprotein
MKSLLFKITLTILFCAALIAGCNTTNKEIEGSKPKMPLRDINEVKEAHVNELMSLPGVVGVYVGELEDHTPCIGVMVVKKTPELKKKIPKTLEGHPVTIHVSGEVKPMK